MTTQAKRLKAVCNELGITRYGEPIGSIYTPRKKGCFTDIKLHTDALSDEQVEGLECQLPCVNIANFLSDGFAIITY